MISPSWSFPSSNSPCMHSYIPIHSHTHTPPHTRTHTLHPQLVDEEKSYRYFIINILIEAKASCSSVEVVDAAP